MKEPTISQARPEWPITTHRAWKKRESKTAYHGNLGYSTRRIPSPTAYASSPEDSSRNNERFRFQPPPVQTSNLKYVDYFTVQRPGSGNSDSNFSLVADQHGPVDENSFFSSFYTLSPNPPTSPQMFNSNDSQSPISGQPLMYSNGQEFSWNGVPPGNSNVGSDVDDVPMSDLHFGSFGSFDSIGLETPNTATSISSEDFVFPIVDSTYGPSGDANPLTGLALSGKLYLFQVSIVVVHRKLLGYCAKFHLKLAPNFRPEVMILITVS